MVRRLLWLALAVPALYLLWLPDVKPLRQENPKTTSLIERRKHQARKAKKPHRVRRTWRNLEQISPHLVHAVILAEDDTFYQHKGFDPQQIRIAFRRNWEKKRFVYGGSTLTQQLARTLYLSPDKNLLRKLKEALVTIQLERHLTKTRILELYLNAAEWGPGVYGAEAASQYYFGTSASALTPDEAVALASILPSPRRWNPLSAQAFMARRRTRLLERMQRAGYVPEDAPPEPAAEEEPAWPEPLPTGPSAEACPEGTVPALPGEPVACRPPDAPLDAAVTDPLEQ